MSTSTTRKRLAEAIAAAAFAKEALESAELIFAVAQEDVDKARSALAQFEGLDGLIAAARLDALKGGDASRLEALTARQHDRLLAREELSAAESTLELARGELDDARGRAGALQPAVNTAATEVLSDEASVIIAELEKAEQQREYLRGVLRGLFALPPNWDLMPVDTRKLILQAEAQKAGLPFGDVTAWEGLSRQIATALSSQHPAGERRPDKWKRFADAILEDPEAEVSIL